MTAATCPLLRFAMDSPLSEPIPAAPPDALPGAPAGDAPGAPPAGPDSREFPAAAPALPVVPPPPGPPPFAGVPDFGCRRSGTRASGSHNARNNTRRRGRTRRSAACRSARLRRCCGLGSRSRSDLGGGRRSGSSLERQQSWAAVAWQGQQSLGGGLHRSSLNRQLDALLQLGQQRSVQLAAQPGVPRGHWLRQLAHSLDGAQPQQRQPARRPDARQPAQQSLERGLAWQFAWQPCAQDRLAPQQLPARRPDRRSLQQPLVHSLA